MISAFVPILFSMFIVVDPIGIVPIYIALTSHIDSPQERRQVITKAVGIAFVVLSLFIVAGRYILNLLQIEPGSFFIAGGIMLFIISLEMLFGRTTGTKVSGKETQDEAGRNVSVAVFPLGIPMLAGPGTITTIILFTGSSDAGPGVRIMLFIALIITLSAVALILHASDLILKSIGRTGVSVLERIMGILLSGLSVQFVYNGITKLWLAQLI